MLRLTSRFPGESVSVYPFYLSYTLGMGKICKLDLVATAHVQSKYLTLAAIYCLIFLDEI